MIGRWTFVVLIFSAFWIFYAAVFSETILFNDSFSYDQAGKSLAQGHFWDYFRTGPNREPLYPLFVALNVRLADFFQIPYTNFILFSQGIILLLSQAWLALILKELRVSDRITAVLLLYFVISPSLLHSSLVIYSEIILYPMTLAAVMVSYRTWSFLMRPANPWQEYARRGVYLGAVFIPLMFVKGIFEVIAPIFMAIVTLSAALHWKMSLDVVKKLAVFFVIAVSVFSIPVAMYKTANKIGNGNYVFTSRGSWALYASMARRVLPVTAEERLAQKLYIFPNKSICERWAGAAACSHWHYTLSDTIGRAKETELKMQGLTAQEVDRKLVELSKEMVFRHPFIIANGMFWEGIKFFFWEHSSWGWVSLPRELKSIYQSPWFSNSVLWGTNILNVLCVLLAIAYCWVNRRDLKQPQDDHRIRTGYVFVILLFVFVYTGVHSLFFLSERNALAIVPAFFILAGVVIQSLAGRFSKIR
jgi:hypothetical protein